VRIAAHGEKCVRIAAYAFLNQASEICISVHDCWLLLQLTASPWTTEASTRERWQFGAL